MGVYQVETDQGTYEITTEEPDQAHPQLPAVGENLGLSQAASDASKAVNPPVAVPQDTSPQGYFSRVLGATKDALLSPIAPFVPSLRNRMFSPQVGQAGPSQFLEQEGQRLGQAVRASDVSGKIASSPMGAKIPEAAYLPMAMGSVLTDSMSQSLTPTAQAQNIGGEALGEAIGAGAKKIGETLDNASTGAARRATGFMKPDLTGKTPFESNRMMAKANEAGKAMLDRGNIPFFGGPQTMNENAVRTLGEGQAQVRNVMDAVDSSGQMFKSGDLGKSISEKIKPRFKDEISAVNAIVDDIESINPEGLSTQNLEDLKTRWGDKGWGDESRSLSKNVRDAYREAYKRADAAIKTHIENVSPDIVKDYTAGKKSMEVASNALKGITRKEGRCNSDSL